MAVNRNLALTTHRLPRVSTSTEPLTDAPLQTGAVLLMGMASKSFVVSQRTREIGIRLALGAARADVLWLVLRDGIWLTAGGIAVGLPLAALIGTALARLLYGVGPFDPIVFVSAPAILAAAALIACYVPARRATRIMPLTALRSE